MLEPPDGALVWLLRPAYEGQGSYSRRVSPLRRLPAGAPLAACDLWCSLASCISSKYASPFSRSVLD